MQQNREKRLQKKQENEIYQQKIPKQKVNE